jgi:predicted DNA-binding transcriptional regulator AlpA
MDETTNIGTNTETQASAKKYLRVWEVACETGRSVRSVWRDSQAGILPKPFKNGHNTYWLRVEILAFMRQLEQKRCT